MYHQSQGFFATPGVPSWYSPQWGSGFAQATAGCTQSCCNPVLYNTPSWFTPAQVIGGMTTTTPVRQVSLPPVLKVPLTQSTGTQFRSSNHHRAKRRKMRKTIQKILLKVFQKIIRRLQSTDDTESVTTVAPPVIAPLSERRLAQFTQSISSSSSTMSFNSSLEVKPPGLMRQEAVIIPAPNGTTGAQLLSSYRQ